MRQQSKIIPRAKVTMQRPRFRTRLQWAYYVHWGDAVFLDVSRLAALRGNYDPWLRKAATVCGLRGLQHDEIMILREYVAKYIDRYDSRKGCLETYLMRLGRWGVRQVRAKCGVAQVSVPHWRIDKGLDDPRCVRIDRYVDDMDGDCNSKARYATKQLEEIRDQAGEIPSPEHNAFLAEAREAILEALESLPERELEIVSRRLEFIMERDVTACARVGDRMCDLAEEFGVSKARIEQLQRRGLERIKKRLTPIWREFQAA